MVKSLNDYLTEIQKLKLPHSNVSSTTLPWYRGQTDSTWHLTPSIYRGEWDPVREREMTRDFRLRALMELDHKPTTYLGWFFVMQHYGLPTRLLDWSESCLVALYFAVEKFNSNSDATVWIMHPWNLNKYPESYNQQSVPPLDKEIDENYSFPINTLPTMAGGVIRIKKDLPIALRPAHTTRRIVAQRGQFTVHGHERTGLDQISTTRADLQLRRIDIAGNSKLSILRELYTAGISRYTLFPDLDGLASEISIRYSKKFMR